MRMPPQHSARAGDELSVDIHSDLGEIRELWLNFEQIAKGGPHDTWEWANAWAQTAGKMCKPLIAIGKDASDRVVFILPLTICRHFDCNILGWLGADQGNYSSGLFDLEAWSANDLPKGNELMHLVLEALPHIDLVHLNKLPVEIGNQFNPLAGIAGIKEASPGHTFPVSADWEAMFNAKFSSSHKHKLRRNERRLADAGSLSLKKIESRADRLKVLDEMFRSKKEWFAKRGITNFLDNEDMRDFFKTLVQSPDRDTGLTVSMFALCSGDEIIATNLGVIFQNRLYGLIASTTSGPALRYGPGRVLFLRLVEQMSKNGIEMIDCGAGEDENKLRWCTQERVRQHAILPITAKGHVYAATLKAALLTKLKIKQSPQLWNLTKRLRKWKAAIGPSKPAMACTPASPARLQT